ncbi:hypothetical protein B0T22DRAFT_464278 [Podospora appendiculata]|uniref:Tom7-domain-containing protein n=1 Tax=Podospora appendiculata TaxID=314037 RepID=A0AAE0X4C8_9PEZI|nr:hypothetical protein B0T22DRAFT_464278 [Podospora appendiculata]
MEVALHRQKTAPDRLESKPHLASFHRPANNTQRRLESSRIPTPPTATMMFALSEESKERISRIIEVSRIAIHYGYLPLVLYLGTPSSILAL